MESFHRHPSSKMRSAASGLEVIGRVPDLVERFYAVIVERRVKHLAVVALSEAARS